MPFVASSDALVLVTSSGAFVTSSFLFTKSLPVINIQMCFFREKSPQHVSHSSAQLSHQLKQWHPVRHATSPPVLWYRSEGPPLRVPIGGAFFGIVQDSQLKLRQGRRPPLAPGQRPRRRYGQRPVPKHGPNRTAKQPVGSVRPKGNRSRDMRNKPL